MSTLNGQSNRKATEISPLAYRYRQASQLIALLVATLGLVILCGWAFNLPTLTYIRPTLQSMKVNTALSFLCLGAGLWLARNEERQRSRRILGLLVAVIAGATLAEYALDKGLGIDQLLFRDTRTPSLSAYPGRMAISTAICFLLLGLAVTFLGTKKVIVLQRMLVHVCFAFTLTALCGYLYGVKSLYSITAFSTIAPHTTAGLMAACLAYFLARPDEGIVSLAASESYSGFLLRTLIPLIIAVPILIGWLGLAGQRARLYDTSFGVALQVLGSIVCLMVVSMLIGRSMHRSEVERGQIEGQRRESEERFRLIANSAPVLIWMSGPDKLCTFFNQGWLDFTGRPMEQEVGQGWASGVHPGDVERSLGTYSTAFDSRGSVEMEYRLRRYDGKYRWMVDYGVPRYGSDGTFLGYIGSCMDITDRKLTEEALLDLSGRLITAHEEERVRIARELHDDLNQRMALLEINLEELKQETLRLSIPARQRLHKVAEIASEISSDIHNLSHELHPSKLESLGLVAAIGGYCREFSMQHGLHIQFSHHQADGRFPKDVTLCIFRIVQEALRNIVKHSGADEARVELSGRDGRIELCVSDSGVGFDPEADMGTAGIGLISMRERLRLVGGHISIESKPSYGTRIRVQVPLSTQSPVPEGEEGTQAAKA